MKVAISAAGQSLDSALDPRFGRAAYFLIVDPDTMSFSVLDNTAALSAAGAGIATAQKILDLQADALITGQLGPNAMDILKDSDIDLYQGLTGSVSDNLAAFKQQTLNHMAGNGPAHAGLGREEGRP